MLSHFELGADDGPIQLLNLTSRHPAARSGAAPAYRRGLLLIIALTTCLILWLTYHWLWQPRWLRLLPVSLQEAVALTETAGAFTLAFIWAGLGWRYWRQQRNARASGSLPIISAERLQTLSPKAFERYVAGLFRQKGYRVLVRGGSGDLGVDLEITGARGRRAIVQCKRYQNTVGAEVVRELYGTLVHEKVVWAFLVTTADISDSAREWAQGKPITLIDGDLLAEIAASLRRKM